MTETATLTTQTEPKPVHYAAVDLGSNSFHMVVAREEHGELRVIDRIKEMVQLATGLQHKHLSGEIEERALACLARFGDRLRGVPQGHVRAVGTNTLRRMKNPDTLLKSGEKALGHPIEIISGSEEARIIYQGVARGVIPRGRRLLIDIGGGSTEFILGDEAGPDHLECLQFGCVRVTQQYFPEGKVTRKRWHAARNAIAVELTRINNPYRESGWQESIGSSGTMKAIRNIVVERGWSERGITPWALKKLRSKILEDQGTEDLIGDHLSERRASVFAGGVAIAEASFEGLGIERMLVSDYALREGLLYELYGRMHDADSLRGNSIEALGQRYGTDLQQAKRVAGTALRLLEKLKDDWQFGDEHANWLRWAAHIHEIGLAISHSGYQTHGAYLVKHSDLPGFSRQEQSMVAHLVRNHRRKPALMSYDALPSRHEIVVIRITALLRIAVLIHRSRTDDAPTRFDAEAQGNELNLSLPEQWMDSRPLVTAALNQEATFLAKTGITLNVNHLSPNADTS